VEGTERGWMVDGGWNGKRCSVAWQFDLLLWRGCRCALPLPVGRWCLVTGIPLPRAGHRGPGLRFGVRTVAAGFSRVHVSARVTPGSRVLQASGPSGVPRRVQSHTTTAVSTTNHQPPTTPTPFLQPSTRRIAGAEAFDGVDQFGDVERLGGEADRPAERERSPPDPVVDG
jgi:hypothetical protein